MLGWVTAVFLCCFCNVALIFATMKTFILQQVKCCHLSYSDWFYRSSYFHFITISLIHSSFSFPPPPSLFPLCFLLHFNFREHPISHCIGWGGSYHGKWKCLVVSFLFFFFWGCGALSHLSIHLFIPCYGFTVTNEKSKCPMDSGSVHDPPVAALLCFHFTGVGGGGSGWGGVSVPILLLFFSFETTF